MKHITYVAWIVAMFISFAWLGYTSNIQAQVMEVEYCWDSNGQHYTAPDERCGH